MILEFHPCSQLFNPAKGYNGVYSFTHVNDKGLSIGDWTVRPKPGREYDVYMALQRIINNDLYYPHTYIKKENEYD